MNRKRRRRANATGRSDGREQYVPLTYPTLRSHAWRSLSGAAVKVWLEIRSRFNGANNGKLSLSLDEAAKLLGLGKTTVARAFKELEAKGFLVLVRQGQWYGRLASEYATTDRSLNGSLPTYAWRHWGAQKQSLGPDMKHIDLMTDPS